jgi:hypothetical protein
VAPPDDPAPRARFDGAYWLAMAFSAVLIAAGAVVGFWGPKLFPHDAWAAHAPGAGLAIRPSPAKQAAPMPTLIGPP